MTWRGEHIGPAGTSSGVMFAAWSDAADWIRAMMEIWRPEGVVRAMKELRETPPETVFLTRIGEHLFRIERDGR